MNKKALILFSFLGQFLFSQNFQIIPLGVLGGSDESNLSAYLISEGKNDAYLSLDAGTIHFGIKNYLAQNNSSESPNDFLKDKIKGYFISHPHFDHHSGLIINSPEDSKKNIYGAEFVVEAFKKHIFSWDTWANFADKGASPTLKKYSYKILTENIWTNIQNTSLALKMHYLSHTGKDLSTAALVRNSQNKYFLYLGDTGADRIEKNGQLNNLWSSIAPLIKDKKLLGIAIECSYSNEQPENQLYGHLTPQLLIEEIENLETKTGKGNLKGLNLIITHIKYKKDIQRKIKSELHTLYKKGINVIFAEQGKVINL